MTLPQETAYFALYNRLKCLAIPSVCPIKPEKSEILDPGVSEYLKIFDKTAEILNKLP